MKQAKATHPQAIYPDPATANLTLGTFTYPSIESSAVSFKSTGRDDTYMRSSTDMYRTTDDNKPSAPPMQYIEGFVCKPSEF